MATRKAPNSSITSEYVTFADKSFKNAKIWLECKRSVDNAEGLWRIHDDLYDMSKYVDAHPGGKSWISLTKGTDITELYETHHLNIEKTNRILAKYHVRKAGVPRNYKLTFAQDGFYQTLKRRVFEHLKGATNKKNDMTNFIADGLVFSLFVTSILSTYVPYVEFIAGLLLGFLVVISHNYFHMRDNFRMYYFNLSLMDFAEWRVSHAISHHMFPNSLLDMELIFLEPAFCWQPKPKNFLQRYGSWLYSPIVYSVLFNFDTLRRFATRILDKERLFEIVDLLPTTIPIAMYVLGAANLWDVLKLWMTIVMAGSFFFSVIGLNAGHHHPEVFHDGDAMRENLDWGVYQMDTMIERSELNGNHFLTVTQFGEHILHHMFPTLDHGYLHDLKEILHATVNEFRVEAREGPWSELIVGNHLQLARTEPSTWFPDIEKKKKKAM